ncbi:DM13 domain-containing protein [Cognatishimia sp. WU-CL00825]|uniref:DM13 domain-containing protein n=1 Tax=Cognatishimia sp. WU-CL00825 TaxID=3127658 RepID=UPI00310AA6D7
MFRLMALTVSHVVTLVVGFGLGVYFLPILVAPASPDAAMLQQKAQGAMFSGEFTRDLRGSDFLHWGEGTVSVTATNIVHEGKLAPGPDYKLYLTASFVENEEEFFALKDQAVLVGDVKTFDGLLLEVPAGIAVADYTSVVIWCESFGEFITAAKYR